MTDKYCVKCGKPLEGRELRQYCCNEHEAAYQEEAAQNGRRPIHDQPYGQPSTLYDRNTGKAIHYPASKYGSEFQAPPNPYLK